jgi:superfamily II DNA or RNA helicase
MPRTQENPGAGGAGALECVHVGTTSTEESTPTPRDLQVRDAGRSVTSSRLQLRPHQTRALELLRGALAGGKRRPLLQAPTGFGKTLLAPEIAEGAIRCKRRAIFTVPALSLIDQTVERFWAQGIRDIGVIQAGHGMTNSSRSIQVASVQTLMRRQIPSADIVIVDEAHRWFDFYGRWMADPAWRSIPFVGLSATPWTKGLGKHFDALIIASTTRELIDSGFLSAFRVFAPSHPDLAGVRTVAGDYHEGDLGEAMNKAPLVADIASTWIERGEGRPTLCYCVDRAHARTVRDRFEASGIACGYMDAYTEPDARREIRRQFHSGEIKIVCNVGVLTTGVDWDVRCIILARPTKSEMLFVQIIGRGLRTADGKNDCLILDHSDTHGRLGFVTDIHHEHLDDGKRGTRANSRKSGEALPKECPSCSFLRPPKVHICPNCGFAPQQQSTVHVVAGELVELTGRPASKLADIGNAALYGQLLRFAREQGYRPGWASYKFRELRGYWPDRLRHVPEMEPEPQVRSWIRSRQIAFAKRRSHAHGSA